MKAYGEVEVQIYVSLTCAMVWVVNFTLRLLYTRRDSPWYQLNRRLGGLQSWPGKYAEVKKPWQCRDLNSDPSVTQPLASRYTDWATAPLKTGMWE
jgi:hypothetical protein